MNKNKLFAICALGSVFFTGCSKVNDEENSVEKVVELKETEEDKTKKEKVAEALSNYEEGVYPLYIDGIVLVNKDYAIPEGFATDLDSELLEQFEIMKSDAKKEGLDINIRSGFRTAE